MEWHTANLYSIYMYVQSKHLGNLLKYYIVSGTSNKGHSEMRSFGSVTNIKDKLYNV